MRGSSKMVLGDEGAISDFSKAIEINPEDGDAFYWRGFAKIFNENFNEGCSDLTKAKKLNSYLVSIDNREFRKEFKEYCK